MTLRLTLKDRKLVARTRVETVARGEHGITFEAQGHLEQLEHIGNIFDDQDGAIESIHSAIVAAFKTMNKSGFFFDTKLLA